MRGWGILQVIREWGTSREGLEATEGASVGVGASASVGVGGGVGVGVG